MALTLSLEKSSAALALCLEKRQVNKIQCDVALALDVSGSFHDEHTDGITTDLITRLVPWAMVFDPDKKMECYTFSHVDDHAGEITEANYQNFISDRVINEVKGYGGTTKYSTAIARILKETAAKKTGFFGKLVGRKDTAERPLIVKFITDGANDAWDEGITRELLRDAQNSGRKVYFNFICVGAREREFEFVKQLADEFSNVGYHPITNLREFVGLSDDEINEALISDEMIEWMKGL
jgi:hypothetical protein